MTPTEGALLKELSSQTSKVLPSLYQKFKDTKQVLTFKSCLERYLRQTAEKCSQVPIIVDPQRRKKLADIYIPLTLMKQRKDVVRLETFDPNFLAKNKSILIVDSAGMGKSTCLKWTFLKALEQTNLVPILIDLRRLSGNIDIIDYIYKEINYLDEVFSKQAIKTLLSAGDFLFLFDGYDEIPLAEKNAVTINIQNFKKHASENYFIMTSRPEPSLSCFTDFESFKIRPLTKKEAYDLLRKYNLTAEKVEQLIVEIESHKSSSISDFLGNPLLVSLLYVAYDHKASIPLKRTVFYEQVYDALFERHDYSKGDSFNRIKISGLEKTNLECVISRFAMLTIQKGGKIEYSDSEFREYLETALKGTGYVTSVDKLTKDLLSAVPLFTQEGAYTKWSHKSFQDYFGATWLMKYSDGKALSFLTSKGYPLSKSFHSYAHLIDLYGELNPYRFKKYFAKPLLEAISNFHSNNKDLITERYTNDSQQLNTLMLTFGSQFAFFKNDPSIKSIDDQFNIALGNMRAQQQCNQFKVQSWHLSESDDCITMYTDTTFETLVGILSNHKVNISKPRTRTRTTSVPFTSIPSYALTSPNMFYASSMNIRTEGILPTLTQLISKGHFPTKTVLDLAKVEVHLNAITSDLQEEEPDEII